MYLNSVDCAQASMNLTVPKGSACIWNICAHTPFDHRWQHTHPPWPWLKHKFRIDTQASLDLTVQVYIVTMAKHNAIEKDGHSGSFQNFTCLSMPV